MRCAGSFLQRQIGVTDFVEDVPFRKELRKNGDNSDIMTLGAASTAVTPTPTANFRIILVQ